MKKLKVFISQPMRGKTNEEIENERKEIIQFANFMIGKNIEILDSFFKDAPHDAQPLWFLGKSFELLSTADIAIFAKGYETARGCEMEHRACELYGIRTFDM